MDDFYPRPVEPRTYGPIVEGERGLEDLPRVSEAEHSSEEDDSVDELRANVDRDRRGVFLFAFLHWENSQE